jgi:hypothetical protein
MNSERWSQIRDLFDASLSLPPSERAQWLDNACGVDGSLRAEVEHLLDHDMRADRDGFLDDSKVENSGLRPTGEWVPCDDRRPVSNGDPPRRRWATPPSASRPRRQSPRKSGSARTTRRVRSSSHACASCRSFTSSCSA